MRSGGSGAGKTTLLDLLACNTSASSSGSSVQGSVTVNGGRQDAREFTKLSCYVQQKDLLYASATVWWECSWVGDGGILAEGCGRVS